MLESYLTRIINTWKESLGHAFNCTTFKRSEQISKYCFVVLWVEK